MYIEHNYVYIKRIYTGAYIHRDFVELDPRFFCVSGFAAGQNTNSNCHWEI
jgi:hypothetical protein